MSRIELYSAEVCPFARRTRMVLMEKGLAFTVTEIDLNHKPDWFARVSPLWQGAGAAAWRCARLRKRHHQ
ncbi:MAG: glutathione S-transferase N-terminal domain-containing protein [Mariprofundaceae bacterium]|nr:glutathione S-transferase N-terminal domain-containing protein [Mariprofundaceae bacterium]